MAHGKQKQKQKQKQNKQKQKPRSKKNVAPQKTPEEAHQEINGMLHQLKDILDVNNAASAEISAFHARTGKLSAANMNSRERAEAKALYTKSLPKFAEGYEHMVKVLNEMKRWREISIDIAREKNELNAIEVMKARHGCLPLLDLEGNNEPYGAGAVQWPESKRLKKKDEVAAFVDSSKTWILAEVVGAISNHRYECIDIDDGDRKIAVFARKQLIPLPKFTVHYERYPYMAIESKGIVLAIFPGTTCFYEGIVFTPPLKASGMYWIRFVDTSKPDNYGDPVEVSERYVVAYRPNPKIYIRPEKREELLALQAGIAVDKTKKKGKKQKGGEGAEETEKTEDAELVEPEEDATEAAVVDDKDVPGPAPKPNYYESPDEDYKKPRKGKKLAKKPKKVKILRAKVPPHKKRISTRQFGKRRVKRKKPVVATEVVAEPVTEKEEVNEVEMESREEEYEDARADLSSEIGDVSEEHQDKEEEEEEEDKDDGEEKEDSEGAESDGEAEVEKKAAKPKDSDGSTSSSSSDSDDSDDSDNSDIFDDSDLFKRIPPRRSQVDDSFVSESSSSSSSSESSSSDDDAAPAPEEHEIQELSD